MIQFSVKLTFMFFSQLREQLHKKDEWATTKEEGWDHIIWKLELPAFMVSYFSKGGSTEEWLELMIYK